MPSVEDEDEVRGCGPRPGWYRSGNGWEAAPVISTFRTVAYVEAVSFLVLLAASFVKRVIEGPDLVPVLGMFHGIIFLVYVVMALKVREGQGWGFWRTIWVVGAATIPFGGFFVGRDLKANEGRVVEER